MEEILAGHGSGGRLMNDMIDSVIKKILGPDSIQIDDSAVLQNIGERIAFTTDSYTITPLFFPGGNIGTLAVNGTVNDLAVMGAAPKYISCSLIIEEGLALSELKEILKSMKLAADTAGVKVVTGDTKVVPKGGADRLYINTAGIGVFEGPVLRNEIKPGDRIITSGTLGDHGITVMSLRNELEFSSEVKSDCAALNIMIADLSKNVGDKIKFVRDATRGGAASVLNEIVKGKDFSAVVYEEKIPVKDEVRGISDLLGLDPLYIANEGKVILICDETVSEEVISIMHKYEEGKNTAVVGQIEENEKGKVLLETFIGGRRILPLLTEEQLPRIC